jgi:hypothetical protein
MEAKKRPGRKATGAMPINRRIQPLSIQRLALLEKKGVSLDKIIDRVFAEECRIERVKLTRGLPASWEPNNLDRTADPDKNDDTRREPT